MVQCIISPDFANFPTSKILLSLPSATVPSGVHSKPDPAR